MSVSELQVQTALKELVDPNTQKDFISSKSARNIKVNGGQVTLDVVLPYPAGMVLDQIKAGVEDKVRAIPGVEGVTANVTWKIVAHSVQRGVKLIPGVKNIVAVASGKGGVGKSTVAVNLAVALSQAGRRVGLLDVDLHGPSVPILLGLQEERLRPGATGLVPVHVGDLKVMSIAFLLAERDAAVIWRGPMKMGVIKQFLAEVDWGDLDYLVIDSPPGTGDEPLSVGQLIPDADGAGVVTTPQEVALADVRRSITFCQQLKLPVLGVIENMSGFVCPTCGERLDPFKGGGGEVMAQALGVRFLGRIPFDPAVVRAGDEGRAYVHHFAETETARAFANAIQPLLALDEQEDSSPGFPLQTGETAMRIAIPTAAGALAMHFGHCESFALFDIEAKTIAKRSDVTPPPHQPGLLPKWLAEQGATVVIAGGMGGRAQGLFADQGIEVIVGAPAEAPEAVVQAYLAGTLKTGSNVCDH